MRLTIITINYNNHDGLQKTVESVVAQTCRDFEWIIIDGGSTDGSKELIEKNQKHFAYWCSEPDKGIYNAMNKGIAKANGDYLLFLNSGDYLYNERVIENSYSSLKDYDFIVADTLCIRNNGEKRIWTFEKHLTAYQLVKYSLSHQSTFIKTKLLKDRPYREDYKIVSDWEQMIYELLVNNRSYHYIPQIIACFYEDGVSRTNYEENNNERNNVLNEYFSQRIQKAILGENELHEIINHIPFNSTQYKCTLAATKLIRKCLQILHIK